MKATLALDLSDGSLGPVEVAFATSAESPMEGHGPSWPGLRGHALPSAQLPRPKHAQCWISANPGHEGPWPCTGKEPASANRPKRG